MGKFKDITGCRFGRLTALYRLHNYRHNDRHAYWLCICDCGNLKEICVNSLCRGLTRSCGCIRKETTSKKSKTHGKSTTKLYFVWKQIKERCNKQYNKQYKDYGGRGIKVCYDWLNDFQTFYDWSISNGYKENLTIDRIDNNGNYEPSNCRWVDHKTQNRNRRDNKYYTINNETHCLSEWCEILNLNYSTIQDRLRHNWAIEKALELEEE